jgi:fatty-acyl-CoA synthase
VQGDDACETITAVIDAVAARTPGAAALELPGRRITYAQLAEASLLAAADMLTAGVQRGDRVAILLARLDEAYLAQALGAARLGAIVVPVHARYKTRELEHLLGDARPSMLLTSSHFASLISALDAPAQCRVVNLGGAPGRQGEHGAPEASDAQRGPASFGGPRQHAELEQVRERERQVRAEDPVRIIYTSGTTANPKGAVHTHRALLAQGEAVAQRLALTSEDRFWTPLPMFHVAGWSTMLAAQARGACFSHVGIFEAGIAVEQITSQRCTVLFPGFETIWMAMLDHPGFSAEALTSARLVINVGVPERMRLMQERVPAVVQVSNTGSTEACGFLAIGLASDPPAARESTAGRELEGMEVRLVDPDSGEEAAPGQPGEMLFRGRWRIGEYYRDPTGTAEAIDAEGWFHSGDLVRRDEAGRLMFLSRIKDMLKVGGENVAAAEIEGFLLTHAAIRAVHVVAAPDARYGEVPAAFVELERGAELSEAELIEFCLDSIATFKVPRYVRTVREWPMSGTKVRKVALRERIAAELQRAGIERAPRLRAGSGLDR